MNGPFLETSRTVEPLTTLMTVHRKVLTSACGLMVSQISSANRTCSSGDAIPHPHHTRMDLPVEGAEDLLSIAPNSGLANAFAWGAVTLRAESSMACMQNASVAGHQAYK